MKTFLRGRDPVIAFSGGVDSTLLAYVAKMVCSRHLAVTVISEFTPSREREELTSIASQLDLNHHILEISLLDQESIISNPPDRCYHCKKMMMKALIGIKEQEGYDLVLDGTNYDDLSKDRPGLRALRELEIKSPLADHGLDKGEIRELSRKMELPTWDRPNTTCLATRIRCGNRIREDDLARIDAAENYLRDIGHEVVRIRTLGDEARIEMGKRHLDSIDVEDFRAKITPKLRDLGYSRVYLDLEPYRG